MCARLVLLQLLKYMLALRRVPPPSRDMRMIPTGEKGDPQGLSRITMITMRCIIIIKQIRPYIVTIAVCNSMCGRRNHANARINN